MNPADHAAMGHQGLSLTTGLALGGAAIIAGIVLAPYIAPAVGLGSVNTALGVFADMHNPAIYDGLAVHLNNALAAVPMIGSKLAEGGLFNSAATALVGVGGVLTGNWISKRHNGKPGLDWGKVIKWGALATSALIALPSILTGLSNGLQYVLEEMVNHKMLSVEFSSAMVDMISSTVGVVPYKEAVTTGLTGAAATLPHFLTCGFSMLPFAASIGTNSYLSTQDDHYVALDTKGKPLPETDANHTISKEEQKLVAQYNQATPVQKIILKKELLDKGYQPDFHKDGTVHLHKHNHHAEVSYSR